MDFMAFKEVMSDNSESTQETHSDYLEYHGFDF